ncbi:hypothetical protein COY90_04975 [Candidatus Roizmanbacteria bacterium CG_4_10_14_0_8_um_filter_39_9]|uniref:Polymerase nucleotidyl transferase domain-containing protein n=1 Tax=Candidatus Roizmanbacteria bacterium CG_4_10_14_0_8_um_filter_39_9 TaxID=1974829 RepID=A0A2M7QBM8_9BACT|nr:MAG: hypothetical protein COY90_04975 [Candidatus Roizmanbacteria bacterium CG_4_10_14_0_8_um_filter_39_9]
MKPSSHPGYSKLVVNTISYFHFFNYSPSFEQIYTFFPEKISKRQLKTVINRFINQKKLIAHEEATLMRTLMKKKDYELNKELNNKPNHQSLNIKFCHLDFPLYTLPQYSINTSVTIQRHIISNNKLALVYCYTKALSRIPLVKMVAITGSASVGNCTPKDDIDIMIIAKRGYLWISRFFTILLSILYNVRNLVCLNLFFDETDLTIPRNKQTPYVAHEILQMKPVIDKGQIYKRFISENRWVRKIYPNSLMSNYKAQITNQSQNSKYKYQIIRLFEAILKQIQLAIIRKNKTSFMITDTQLWLFRRDFEKKIRSKL